MNENNGENQLGQPMVPPSSRQSTPPQTVGGSSMKPKIGFPKKLFGWLWEVAKIIIIAVIIVLPIRYFLFQPFIVKGDSMVPNYQSGDYLIVDEISYRLTAPERGDVVVLKYPLDTTQRFIKRIIGLPGETVQVRGGKVTISKNGQSMTLDETYLPKGLITEGNETVTLQGDQYFVM